MGVGQPNALNRYRSGLAQGQQQAYNEANLAEDLKTLALGVASLPSDIIESAQNEEVGPIDGVEIATYYDALLKLQDRYEEAGYIESYVKSTQARLEVLGLASGQAFGLAVLSVAKRLSLGKVDGPDYVGGKV